MNLRPNIPSVPLETDETWLYVPFNEVGEALAIGAKIVEGDSRLSLPNPKPKDLRPFERWRTDGARYKWALDLLKDVFGERVSITDPKEGLLSLQENSGSSDKVYLYVPSYDINKIKEEPGVHWDRRLRQFYATPDADIKTLFQWLTPAAIQCWEAENAMARALTLLVQERARSEFKGGGIFGGGEDIAKGGGAPRFVKPPSRTRA